MEGRTTFFWTRQITEKRRNAIRETYEEVCRFMRYYHGLAKWTERDGWQGRCPVMLAELEQKAETCN